MRSTLFRLTRPRASLLCAALLAVSATSAVAQTTQTKNTLRIPLSGLRVTAAGPVIPVTPALPGAISLSSATLDFGNVATNTTESREVTLTNNGGSLVAFSGPSSFVGDAGFSFLTNPCTGTLAVNDSCVASVNFTPTAVGRADATVSFPNDTAGTPNLVGLTATAYNPVSLDTATLPVARRNQPYAPFSFQSLLQASNETTVDSALATWAVQGTLPAGMTLNSATGALSGTPTALTAAGGVDFTVRATYKLNQGERVYTIQVGEAILEVTQIVAGLYHTCAITPSKGVKCWGKNQYGQLGDGTFVSRTSPVDVPNLTAVASLALGGSHTCALTTSGVAKCWGYGGGGQLGNGSTANQTVPTNVSNVGAGVLSLSAGNNHGCAVTAAGGVMCWGYNSSGEVGDGSTSVRNAPVNVAGPLSGISKVASGASHACALTDQGGVKCWGAGGSGQLGNSSSANSSSPVNVATLSTGVSSIELGNTHSCAVVSGGAKCWGSNGNGQIGDNSTLTRTSPVNVANLTSGVSSISAGSSHTCAVTTSGLKCWGNNATGQLGIGSTTPAQSLTQLSVPGLSSGVLGVTAGLGHTCVLTESDGAKCWGQNDEGQVGTGNTTNSSSPMNVGL